MFRKCLCLIRIVVQFEPLCCTTIRILRRGTALNTLPIWPMVTLVMFSSADNAKTALEVQEDINLLLAQFRGTLCVVIEP